MGVSGFLRPAPDNESSPAAILCVDHDETNRYALSRILEAEGFEVLEAAKGADALRFAAERPPALVVLDVRLPDMNGFDVCRRLKANPRTAPVPVLHTSILGKLEHDYPESLKSGADAYLQSPVEPPVFVAVVKALIRAAAERPGGRAKAEAFDILESIGEAVFLLDNDYRYVYVNAEAERLLGFERSALIGNTPLEVFPESLGTTADCEFRRVMTGRTPASFEDFYEPGQKWFEVRVNPVAGGGIAVFFRDITGQRRDKEALLESEQRFRALVTASSDVLFRFNPDWSELLQLRGADLVAGTGAPNRNWLHDYIHPADQPAVMGAVNEAIRTGGIVEFEHRVRRADGSLSLMFSRAVPVKDANGRIVEWFGAASDITRRKRAEEDALRSGKTFAELVERAPFGIYIVDSGFRLAHMNVGSQNGSFRNVRPVIGRDLAEVMRILWPEPVAAEIIRAFRHTLDTGEPYHSPPFINPRHDVATVESYEWELHRMTLPDGQHGVICYYFDSTELRTAEAALRASEERLRMALDAARIGTYEFYPQTGKFFWDDRIAGIWDLRPGEEVTYPEAIQRVHPEDREAVGRAVAAALEPGSGGSFDCEYRILWPDGSVHSTRAKGRVYFEGEGGSRRAARMVGIQLDTTEWKRAEQALAADLAALTRMHALSTSLIESGGLEPLLQNIMDSAVAITGAARGTLQLLEGDSLRILAHHGHGPRFLEFFASAEARASVCGEVLACGARVVVEDVESSPLFAGTPSLEILRDAGVRAVQSTPLLNRNGALLGILTTQWSEPYKPDQRDLRRVDLLARQAADLIENSRSRAALLKAAQFPEQNPNPVLRIAPGGRLDYANQAARSWLAGMGAPERGPLPPVVEALVERVVREQRVIEDEIDSEGGRTFWFTAVQPPGQPYVNLYGRDTTERRRAEEKLFETNQRLQALMDALPVGVSFSDDATCEHIAGNPTFLAQFEVGLEDNLSASAPNPAAPGRQVSFFQDGREVSGQELPLQRAVRDGAAIQPVELEIRLPSGRVWFAEASSACPGPPRQCSRRRSRDRRYHGA